MKMNNIIISNKEKLEETIKRISRDGKERFHVIADFDRTLTKAIIGGKKTPTVIAQIRDGNYLTQDYAPKAYALYDEYRPIEINPNINSEEKNKKMHEWWKKHFDLLIECGMNQKVIEDIVRNKKLKFRKGSLRLLDILNNNKVPLIIMSAGPGDMIRTYLESERKMHPNIYLIANFFIFDKDGNAIGIKEQIIHSLNKHEIEIKRLPVYRDLLKRKNVLLLGDNLEDIGMIEGFPYDNLIKIGFLNENIEENLNKFKKAYDIVILNDGEMNYVNRLLKRLINN